jgi:hypothetical protein
MNTLFIQNLTKPTMETRDEEVEKVIDEYTEMMRGTAHKPLQDWLRQALQTAKMQTLRKAIENIEIARQEHNDARHGNSTDDAYDRACDAINPDLTPPLPSSKMIMNICET